MAYVIEPLRPEHERGAFCCGNEIIDKFCARALKEHDQFKVRVKIIRDEDSSEVLGFYSLCLSTIESQGIFGLKKFGQRPIPAIYLAMIGVNEALQGQGLGRSLMSDAFETAYEIAKRAGTYCMWLEAVSEEKAVFYEGLGFRRIEEAGLRMYIPITAIIDLINTQTDEDAA